MVSVLLFHGVGLDCLEFCAFGLGCAFSGFVCLMFSQSFRFLHCDPVAPLFASSSAASFPMSLLCPLICSNLSSLVFPNISIAS